MVHCKGTVAAISSVLGSPARLTASPSGAMAAAVATRDVELLEDFEKADAEAAQTYQQQAGSLRRGSYVMMKGHPCRIVEVSISQTGKHGHAKVHMLGLDIFTGKKYDELSQTSHNVEVPVVTKTEYPLMNLNVDTGAVSLLQENGELKIDLNLPTRQLQQKTTEEDAKVEADIVRAFTNDLIVTVLVIAACGMEKIIGFSACD